MIPEPRWPALLAGLAVGVLFYLMPEHLDLGPRWLPSRSDRRHA